MDPISQATGAGITKVMDYGLAMAVIVLVGICGAWLIRYLLTRCDERFETSVKIWKSESVENRAVQEKIVETVNELKVTMAEYRAELRARDNR